eukprot:m.287748 g.287748  ORF g.287748 m.287748 type:complete len:478 (+) comp16365_c2_seq6:192-1625(+)
MSRQVKLNCIPSTILVVAWFFVACCTAETPVRLTSYPRGLLQARIAGEWKYICAEGYYKIDNWAVNQIGPAKVCRLNGYGDGEALGAKIITTNSTLVPLGYCEHECQDILECTRDKPSRTLPQCSAPRAEALEIQCFHRPYEPKIIPGSWGCPAGFVAHGKKLFTWVCATRCNPGRRSNENCTCACQPRNCWTITLTRTCPDINSHACRMFQPGYYKGETTTTTLSTSTFSSTKTKTSTTSFTTSTLTSSTHTSTSSTMSYSTTTSTSISTSTTFTSSTSTASTETTTSTSTSTTETSTLTSKTTTSTISTQSMSTVTITTTAVSATTTTKTLPTRLVVQEGKPQFIHVSVGVVILLVILNCLFFLMLVYLRRKYNETVQAQSIVEHKPHLPDDLYGNPTYVAPENYAEIVEPETNNANAHSYDHIGELAKPQTTNENSYDDFGELGEQDEQPRGSEPDYWYNEAAVKDSEDEELYC